MRTDHPRIRKASERYLPLDALHGHLDALRASLAAGSAAGVRAMLSELIAADRAEQPELPVAATPEESLQS